VCIYLLCILSCSLIICELYLQFLPILKVNNESDWCSLLDQNSSVMVMGLVCALVYLLM